MRFGLAMFGLSASFLKDPEDFLARMSGAGYRYLEPCLYQEAFPVLRPFTWTEEAWDGYAPMLEKYGFLTESLHVYPNDLLQELPALIRICKKFSVKQLVVPCPGCDSVKAYENAADNLKTAAAQLHSEGIALLMHNGKDASAQKIGDLSVFEWMLRRCGGTVGAQADVGWLLYGGVDPEAFLWRNEKLIWSLHYKDMSESMQEVPVGKGLVDMSACFQFARAKEIIQIVDQDIVDFPTDPEFAANRLRELAQSREGTKSILCILDTQTGAITKLHTFAHVIEAPNWMQTDDDCLIYNSDGLIYQYRISTDTETKIDTGHCVNCNNDHVLSPDNTQIAVSHSETGWMSQIYILPIAGGEPKLITPNAPSFLHGWSPDGKELAYCAFRDHGNGMEVDVYSIPAQGGEEKQLTRNVAFNDGPEYSPDGKFIWFNSTRSGLMQCWRMERNGSNPTQMTFAERNNWFPHVSPDGKQVVYLSYSKDGLDPNEHLPNMQVQLRLMNADGSNDRMILAFFGGQGSINVNSWNRDSRRLAFVMYELEHK